jgi:osmotically-inducible protein OsmY
MKRRFRGMLVGWVLSYFLDPVQGKRRRAVARDWGLARLRGVGRLGQRRGRYLASQAGGAWQRRTQAGRVRTSQPDDATLAHKVETEIFRDATVPKGQIIVNAEHGVVYLRGEVPEQAMLDALVERTREVQGVIAVESLLHLPGQPAPMHGSR